MKNYVSMGDVQPVIAAAAVASGDFIIVGAVGGVAQSAAANGATVYLNRYGVHTLPKATGETWARGDQLYWDPVAKKFTKTSTSNVKWGYAASVTLSADTTGDVGLSGNG